MPVRRRPIDHAHPSREKQRGDRRLTCSRTNRVANATNALERMVLEVSSGKLNPSPPSWENEGNADAVDDGGCTCWDAIAQEQEREGRKAGEKEREEGDAVGGNEKEGDPV